MAHAFPYDFEIADHRILNHSLGEKHILSVSRESLDSQDAFKDVRQIHTVTFHIGLA